jgi:hypothetical protein
MNICDPSIFDNSDIFIGDNGVVVPESMQVVKQLNNYADIDEESLCQSHLLTVLNNWWPSGREAEERCKYSEQSQRWHQSWTPTKQSVTRLETKSTAPVIIKLSFYIIPSALKK